MEKIVAIGYKLGHKIKFIRKFFWNLVSVLEMLLLSGYKKDQNILSGIRKIRKKKNMTVSTGEAFLIHSIVKYASNLPGDMAEVGVFQGTTAKIICLAKADKPLHLFDTFTGLPVPDERDEQYFKEGSFAASLGEVQEYLQEFGNLHYYPGLFPGTAEQLKDQQFSFVHLDVDIYQSMFDGLIFFYPRLITHGILVAHDYHQSGVKQAFKDYFSNVDQHVIELPNSQALVLKH